MNFFKVAAVIAFILGWSLFVYTNKVVNDMAKVNFACANQNVKFHLNNQKILIYRINRPNALAKETQAGDYRITIVDSFLESETERHNILNEGYNYSQHHNLVVGNFVGFLYERRSQDEARKVLQELANADGISRIAILETDESSFEALLKMWDSGDSRTAKVMQKLAANWKD